MPKATSWYNEYFKARGTFTRASRYVVTKGVGGDNHNAATALWCRDNASMLWSLTELGKKKAEQARHKLDYYKQFRQPEEPVKLERVYTPQDVVRAVQEHHHRGAADVSFTCRPDGRVSIHVVNPNGSGSTIERDSLAEACRDVYESYTHNADKRRRMSRFAAEDHIVSLLGKASDDDVCDVIERLVRDNPLDHIVITGP